MKNIWVLIILILVAVVLGVSLFTFQVRETEKVVVTFFGRPIRAVEEPGLYGRWPVPINVVHKFDSRSFLYQGSSEETNTAGGEPIIVANYLVWRVADPLKFLKSVQDKTGAETKLESLLRNAQNSSIGKHYFSEFVNSDRSKIKFADIEEEIKTAVAEHAAREYGIEIEMVGIKQLKVSKETTKAVFDRMKADRQRKTDKILADGRAEDTRIRTEARVKRDQLLAIAEAQAKAIRGAGDAEAAKYYKMLDEDPELAMFLRNIEALKKILEKKSTIVLSADSEPVKLLSEIPDIEPKQ